MLISGGITRTILNPKGKGPKGNLEYDKLLRNPLLTCLIQPPVGRTIVSALRSDFGFSLGNTWNNLVPQNMLPFVTELNQGVTGVLGAVAGATQFSMEALWATSASWGGSKMPTFPLSLLFVKYAPDEDIFTSVLKLAEGTLPPDKAYNPQNTGAAEKAVQAIQNLQLGIAEGLGGLTKNVSGLFIDDESTTKDLGTAVTNMFSQMGVAAPCNYGLQQSTSEGDVAFVPKPNTTFSLKIGNWFQASDLLIDSIGSINFSKEITPSGSPLFAEVNVTFRPYRMITYLEFMDYFKLD